MKLRIVLPVDCPYRCIYCYKEGMFTQRSNKIGLEELEYLIKKAREFGIEDIEFTGGEPTNYKHLLELIDCAKKFKYKKILITTIGVRLASNNYCTSLKKKGINGINFTVNSFDQRIYQQINKSTKEQYDLMRKGLENAIRVFGKKLNINVVLTSLNVKTIPEIINYASKKGVNVKILEMLDEDKKAPEGLYYSPEKFKENLRLLDGKEITSAKEAFKFKRATILIVNSCCPRKECNICRSGHQVIRITPDGKLKTCIATEKGEIDILKELKKKDDLNIELKFKKALRVYQ
jgi:GTP 3',8-cyclase